MQLFLRLYPKQTIFFLGLICVTIFVQNFESVLHVAKYSYAI